ncbi:MAG TPA: biotin carboxylase N-terminal domain-containing protein [Euzebyales bacterium]
MSPTIMFDRVLVANRGEIAVRIIRTLQRLGVTSVAVFSDADADAPHVRLADLAVRLGPAAPADSYLHTERVVTAAVETGATALHPGYGFLSENPALARACQAAGVTFVGPPVGAIEAMGDKARARALMRDAGIPVVPGTDDGDLDEDALVAAAAEVGLPVMVKPVAGGGGKGMTVVTGFGDLREAIGAARRQAAAAFGDDRVLLERFVERPRHIEVQVLADRHGTTVHVGERECSLQRRHQKVVEEAPSPLLDGDARAAIGASAVAAALACGYQGAGTIEYIVPADHPDTFYFLEMNTRLQVEHPVTELLTGIDLVEWQLRIAAGEALTFGQDDVVSSGHAVEARVYAEDPARGFLPTGGRVLAYGEPSGPGVRVDSGIGEGTTVPSVYDPLLAKVIVHGPDRPAALLRLRAALERFVVLGFPTNVGFLRRLVAHPAVRDGAMDTGLVERELDALTATQPPDHVLVAAALADQLARERRAGHSVFDLHNGWRIGGAAWTPVRLTSGGRAVTVHLQGPAARASVRIDDDDVMAAAAHVSGDWLHVDVGGLVRRYVHADDGDITWVSDRGTVWAVRRQQQLAAAGDAEAHGGPVLAPMPGTVLSVHVADGDEVRAGQPVVVMEAMKMEHQLRAPADGVVRKLSIGPGDQVARDQTLLAVEADDTSG